MIEIGNVAKGACQLEVNEVAQLRAVNTLIAVACGSVSDKFAAPVLVLLV